MLPRLNISLRRDEIEALDTLEYFATRAESNYHEAASYRAPPVPEKSLFPDLAYRPSRKANLNEKLNETVAVLNRRHEQYQFEFAVEYSNKDGET